MTTITGKLCILGVNAQIELTGAPEVTSEHGMTFTPTLACWNHNRYDWHGPAESTRYVLLRSSKREGAPYAFYEGMSIPGWVPTPPAGWDACIIAESEVSK